MQSNAEALSEVTNISQFLNWDSLASLTSRDLPGSELMMKRALLKELAQNSNLKHKLIKFLAELMDGAEQQMIGANARSNPYHPDPEADKIITNLFKAGKRLIKVKGTDEVWELGLCETCQSLLRRLPGSQDRWICDPCWERAAKMHFTPPEITSELMKKWAAASKNKDFYALYDIFIEGEKKLKKELAKGPPARKAKKRKKKQPDN